MVEQSFNGQSNSTKAWSNIECKSSSCKELHNGAQIPSYVLGVRDILREYRASRNGVEKDSLGFYVVKYSLYFICTFILFVM